MEFNEEQKFDQLWIWLTLIGSGLLIIGIFGYGFIKQVILGMQFGDRPMSNDRLTITFVITFLIFSGIIILFRTSRLVTKIDKFRIDFRFIPFQFKFKTILWSEIDKFEVRKYKPILEFGGWGVRYSINGKAYNVKGNMGLQLYLKNGKKILIGTQKDTELNEFLKRLKGYINFIFQAK